MNKDNQTRVPAEDIVVGVSEADHQAELDAGVDPEHALKPGRHVFRRGGFRERHPDFKGSKKTETKVRISICLDLDILNHFKGKAAEPNAAPYQTQINAALRQVMESQQQAELQPTSDNRTALLNDEQFIAALAERVAQIRRVQEGR